MRNVDFRATLRRRTATLRERAAGHTARVRTMHPPRQS